MGNGNWPPARKLASFPFTAMRLGSARICNRLFCCSASTTRPKSMSLRKRNRFRALVILTVGGVGAVDVVVVPAVVVVVVELVEIDCPPNCPVLTVPVVWPVLGVK